MFHNALSIALTSAIFASTATAAWAAETDSQCARGNCVASCTGNTCTLAKDRLIRVSISSESGPNAQCATTSSCKSGADCTLCAADGSATPTQGDQCKGCADCQSATRALTTIQTEGKRGTNCPCSATATVDLESSNHLAVLHSRLVQEITKNTMLTAELQVHAELAQARKDFAKRMLNKEIEVAHLQAELRLANERTKMSQKVGGAMAENARLKASVELTRDRYELLKHVVTQENSQQAEDLAAALAESKADNARLKERIVVLGKHLETLRVRLANKPADGQVK